jgi:hypothetical protein
MKILMNLANWVCKNTEIIVRAYPTGSPLDFIYPPVFSCVIQRPLRREMIKIPNIIAHYPPNLLGWLNAGISENQISALQI